MRYINRLKLHTLFIYLLLAGCIGNNNATQQSDYDSTLIAVDSEPVVRKAMSQTAHKLDSMGLVDVEKVIPGIKIELIYATDSNFTGEILYGDLKEAYLVPEVALKLANAQAILKEINADYSLVIYDAARPMSVQRTMYNVATKHNKQKYVANPANGGLHNFGAAVDVSIIDSSQEPLPMGSEFDHFGALASMKLERELLGAGRISRQEYDNRLLLRSVMTKAGFITVSGEWWHFNDCPLSQAKQKYKLIDF